MLGPVALAPTLRIAVDVPVTWDIPNDRVDYSSVGLVSGGTPDLTLLTLPAPGVEFRVVPTSGVFAVIQGADAFVRFIEDGDGVLLIRWPSIRTEL